MLEKQIQEFKKYFEQFDTNDEHISMKYFHSLRVMNFSLEIAKSLNLNNEMIELCGLIGLLHDIGRFEQWTRYGTYSDLKTVDHAALGVEILKKDNYIKNYIEDENAQSHILTAIFEHNKYSINENLNPTEILLSKIIRDADKLDIMEHQANSITPNIIAHEEAIQSIYEKRCCIKKTFFNEADKVLTTLCFIFDFNFPYSFQYIKEKDIATNKIKLLENHIPSSFDIREIEKIANEQIKTNGGC